MFFQSRVSVGEEGGRIRGMSAGVKEEGVGIEGCLSVSPAAGGGRRRLRLWLVGWFTGGSDAPHHRRSRSYAGDAASLLLSFFDDFSHYLTINNSTKRKPT
jgi:hypothetical protein